MRLLLIRHGQTDSNRSGALDTEYPGAELNDTGRREAESLVIALRNGTLPRPDKIISSFIVRTLQTSQPLADACGLEVLPDERLREIRAGDLEMATDYDSIATYLNTIRKWVEGDLDARMPGAESGSEVFARFNEAVTEASADLDSDQTLAVFAHGAVIRYYATQCCQEVTLGLIAQHPVPNASFAILEGQPGNWRCTHWASLPIQQWKVDEAIPAVIKSSRELLEIMDREIKPSSDESSSQDK